MFLFVYVIVSVNEDMNGDESWWIVVLGILSVSVRCGEREKKGKRICKLCKDLQVQSLVMKVGLVFQGRCNFVSDDVVVDNILLG